MECQGLHPGDPPHLPVAVCTQNVPVLAGRAVKQIKSLLLTEINLWPNSKRVHLPLIRGCFLENKPQLFAHVGINLSQSPGTFTFIQLLALGLVSIPSPGNETAKERLVLLAQQPLECLGS